MIKKLRRACRDALIFLLDKTVPSRVEREFGTLCFSQTGEDGILNSLLPAKGFYFDVGAHHPLRYSNPHLLYRRGWSGINIDPTPNSMDLFEQIRTRDINLEIAVGKYSQRRKFYVFKEGASNTFDSEMAKDLIQKKTTELIGCRTVPCLPLKKICQKHVPAGQDIGLLSVDAEGHDLEILESHDWRKYRPKFVVVEHHNQGPWKNPACFLRKKGYRQAAKTTFSLIFRQDT